MVDKKKVLGRGLGALISSSNAGSDSDSKEYISCPISDITPFKGQPRKRFDDSALKELADSIREKGVLEPLLVRRDSTGFELIAGERRLRAAQLAGLNRVPVRITQASDEECLEIAIIENIQRQDLNAMEEAEAYRHLMSFGLTQEAVAKKVGKERATVANYLRLLKLPIEVRDELVKGAISMGHARALLAIESHSAQVELCRRIITKGLSVREAEAAISTKAVKGAKKTAKTREPSSLEDELRVLFGTKIVVQDRNGKGRIQINYFSADERERIIEMLRTTGG
ncbi:MAG: ParB/RepB/Spo0J family partition protein [Deltaproteobacteria bacterium]|nr:ParB/RepB/Spo0J family partition protein [Deltaproteobacteria bacterium]